jgi:hypothetical protein
MGPLLCQVSRRRILLVLLSAGVALSVSGEARSQEPSTAEKQREQAKLVDQWRRYGRNFVVVDGKFIRLPSELDELPLGNVGFRSNHVFKQISVGAYGCLFSVRVLQVMDDSNMTVTDVYNTGGNAGANRSPAIVRLAGLSTRNYADGESYSDLTTEVAIVSRWSYPTVLGAKKVAFLAVPLDHVLRGLTLEQFMKLAATNIVDLGPDRRLQAEVKEQHKRAEEQAKRDKERRLQLEEEAQEKAERIRTTEAAAAGRLKLAKAARAEGRSDIAKRLLRELIAEYPNTTVVKDAKALLMELSN